MRQQDARAAPRKCSYPRLNSKTGREVPEARTRAPRDRGRGRPAELATRPAGRFKAARRRATPFTFTTILQKTIRTVTYLKHAFFLRAARQIRSDSARERAWLAAPGAPGCRAAHLGPVGAGRAPREFAHRRQRAPAPHAPQGRRPEPGRPRLPCAFRHARARSKGNRSLQGALAARPSAGGRWTRVLERGGARRAGARLAGARLAASATLAPHACAPRPPRRRAPPHTCQPFPRARRGGRAQAPSRFMPPPQPSA
jgi:hypothetical protein